MVNKTVKVFSEDYHEQAENYIFKWKPPIGPNKEKILFNLKNDMLIFTPTTKGNYEVNLSIEDISDEVIAKEIFYFKAIPETTEVAIVQSKKSTAPAASTISKLNSAKQAAGKIQTGLSKEKKSKKPSNKNKRSSQFNISNAEYAIQISAWPTLEEARTHQLELIDKGFDAYTQHFYLKKRDQVWYRVRVGNFMKRNKALKVMGQIESITGITTWLDIVSTQ